MEITENDMDDIYFTDKKGRRNGNGDKAPSDRFTESGYEAPEYNAASYSKPSGNFSVKLPDEEKIYVPKADRTPGRRVSAAPPPSRHSSSTPSKAPVYEVPDYGYDLSEDYEDAPARTAPRVGSPSRQPIKAPTPQKKPQKKKKKKKAKVGGKIAVALIMLLAVAVIGVFAYGYSVIGEINYDDTITENAYVDKASLMSSPSVTNILIIGSDARDYDGTEGQRSDSMILFSIDKLHRQIKLTSFLRDSYVYIPEVEYEDKLNASFSYGGAQLTMDTIEYNFGVDIDHYVIVNFEIFTQLVDLLGGITVDGVTEEEVYYMTNTLSFPNINVGSNDLNGFKALWYCRMRTLDDDFHRTERQRKVIKSIIKKAASTNPFTLMDIVKQIVPNISTDIPRSELLDLGAGAALSFIRYDIVQQQIPVLNTWHYDYDDYGSSIISVNLEQNREALRSFIFEKYDENQTTTFPATEEYDYSDDDGYGDYDRGDDYGYGYDESYDEGYGEY